MSQTKTSITFWGTRGSVATPGPQTEKYGGNTSCVSVKHNNSYFVFDAGTGIRAFGDFFLTELAEEKCQPEINLLLSHTHWDHIQGLPFFSPAYKENINFNIFSRLRNKGQLEKLLTGQMEQNYFPIPMSKMSADIQIKEFSDTPSCVDNIDVSNTQQEHPGGSHAYKLNCNGKTVVYSTDNELNLIFDNDANPLNEKAQAYLKFIQDADLLIADGQYTDEEYLEKKGWGHSTISILLKVASKAKVKRTAVFHHDPYHSDTDLDEISQTYFEDYQSIDPDFEFFWAKEGLVVQL